MYVCMRTMQVWRGKNEENWVSKAQRDGNLILVQEFTKSAILPLYHTCCCMNQEHMQWERTGSQSFYRTHGSVVLTEELLAGIHFHFVIILCSLFLGAKDRDHLSLCISYRLIYWDLKKKSQSHLFVEHAVFNSRLCAVLLPFMLLVSDTYW